MAKLADWHNKESNSAVSEDEKGALLRSSVTSEVWLLMMSKKLALMVASLNHEEF